MMKKLASVLTACVVVLAAATTHAGSLSDLLPNLFGPNGITLAPPVPPAPSHAAHFTVTTQEQLTVLNDSLRGQLSTVPLPSAASGLVFKFDPALGAFTRTGESFGPIYSQRADTIGKGKITIGGSYSRFTFDKLDGKDLSNGDLTVTFTHEPIGAEAGLPPFFFEKDTIKAQIIADITSDVVVLTATYGLLENLDLSIALPIIHTEMKLKGIATIVKTGTQAVNPDIHRFADGSDTLTVRSSGESTGVGDIVLRAKWNFFNTGPYLFATGLDLRLPSGSVDNLRGVGTPIVSPAFIFSTQPYLGFSPHVNVGFNLSTNTSKFDHELFYNLGFDWAAFKPVTFVFDILGRRVINNHRLEAGQDPGGTQIAGSDLVDASIGLKINVWKNVLGVVNVLLPLNNTGLRDKATPLVGLEVTF